MSNTFVVLMGVGTVFIGLVSIVFLCLIIGAVCKMLDKGASNAPAPAAVNNTIDKNVPIENKQMIIAAVSAAIAEELGTDVSAIRVLSFKRK